MRTLRIGLDLDGVVYDLVDQMLPLLTELAGKDVHKESIVEFNIQHALGLRISNRDLFQKVAERQLYWNATRPIVMAGKSIEKLCEEGHDVKIVTSRPRCVQRKDGSKIDIESPTRDWVHRFIRDGLAVEVRGENFDDPTEKVTFEDKFDIFVDDEPRSLARVRTVPGVTTRPVAFDQPWNQSWAGDRVADWRDLLDLVRDSMKWGERVRRTFQDFRRG